IPPTNLEKMVAVGMPVTQHPPHRSRRAALPHRAPASGDDAQTQSACRTQSSTCDRENPALRPAPGMLDHVPLGQPPSLHPLPPASSGAPDPLFEGFIDTMGLSASLHPCITGVPLRFPVRTWRSLVRPEAGPPGFRTQCFYACQRSPPPPGPSPPCQNGVDS